MIQKLLCWLLGHITWNDIQRKVGTKKWMHHNSRCTRCGKKLDLKN